MTKKTRDILYSVILIIFALACLVYANESIKHDAVKYTLARPDRYIQGWLWLLALLSVLLFLRIIKRNDTTVSHNILHTNMMVTVSAFLLFLIIMPYVGYTIAAFLFLFSITLYYNIQSHKKQQVSKDEFVNILAKTLIYALVLAVCSAIMFEKILKVRLPDILF